MAQETFDPTYLVGKPYLYGEYGHIGTILEAFGSKGCLFIRLLKDDGTIVVFDTQWEIWNPPICEPEYYN